MIHHVTHDGINAARIAPTARYPDALNIPLQADVLGQVGVDMPDIRDPGHILPPADLTEPPF